jgi:hypothetical protein
VQNWLDGQPEGLQLDSDVSPPSETASFPTLPEPDGEELTQEEADMLNARFQGRLRGGDGTWDRVCEDVTSIFTRVQNRSDLWRDPSPHRQHIPRNKFTSEAQRASRSDRHMTPAVHISTSMEHARGQRKRQKTTRQHDFCMPYSYTSTYPQSVTKHAYPRFITVPTPYHDIQCVHRPCCPFTPLIWTLVSGHHTSSTVRIAKGPAGLRLRSSV